MPLHRTGRQFHGDAGLQRSRHAPRTHPFDDLDHIAIGAHEQHVDRESHPEGVNGPAWRKHQCMTVGQRVAAKESLATALRIQRWFDDLGDHRTSPDVHERARVARCAPQRAKEGTQLARAVVLARVPASTNDDIVNGGSIGRSRDARPERNSRKSTLHACVERKLRNRL
jgi:hypothetical protein